MQRRARLFAPRHLLAALALVAGSTPALAAGSATMPITATVLSRAICAFSSNATLAIPFGTIDPADSDTKTRSVSTSFRCVGLGLNLYYTLTASNGGNALAPGVRRMRNTAAPAEFLPYSLSISPATGAVVFLATQNVTITASIAPGDYRNARAGNYSDTVVLTLNP